MAGSALQKDNLDSKKDLLKSPSLNAVFQYLQNGFCPKLTKAGREFWGVQFNFTLAEIAHKPSPLWKENDFFVTRINPARDVDLILKISDTAAGILFSGSIGRNSGAGEGDFLRLKDITELEADILKSFNEFLYKGISDLFLDTKQINSVLHTIREEKTLYLTFYVYLNPKQAAGRIILSLPQFIIKKILPLQPPENLRDINAFIDSPVEVDVSIGKTFAALDDIKALEPEDVVILDESNIHTMHLKMPVRTEQGVAPLRQGSEGQATACSMSMRDITININPGSQPVIMGEDNRNSGDITMTEQRNTNKSIWDSLEVEVGASFEKVKMRLGSLREITEGLVIDVASVADNKVFLDVEGRKIASGELVIVGDKYAVKVTGIINEEKPADAAKIGEHSSAQGTKPVPAPVPKAAVATDSIEKEGEQEDIDIEEDFDETDFDLEDEETEEDDEDETGENSGEEEE